MNSDTDYKINKYRTKFNITQDPQKKKIYSKKIEQYQQEIYTKTAYQIADNDGRIENGIYDIHAENKMYTHGLYTKNIDDISMVIARDKNDILMPRGDSVAYDIRINNEKRKQTLQDMYIPQPPDITNIVENYILAPYYEENQILTTETGTPLYNNQDSLKLGERGPTVMDDFHFRQKMRHFDHEEIPERVVHARGSGAFGTFTCTKSMQDFTMAHFLNEVGKQTPVFVRFSQVVGSKGSPDTVRDVRGFATKFYTQEGNYDLVGNNIPVFFIQDAIKFPDVVHSIKPEEDSEMPQASAAHDNFWDFISLTPEAAHMLMWVISDIGVMRSYRTMEGAGVNTYKFVKADGTTFFVKFHWKPHLGIETLSHKIFDRVAGADIDYLRRDLWEAIKRGFYPKWDFVVQIMPISDENNYKFDPLDATKIWPEKLIPMIKCGELVLNRNPSNFFAEVEQSAFHVGNLVPGIDISDDPLLQGRLFSYDDTQLNRFHSTNFNEIPVNKPIVPIRNNQRKGFMRMRINRGPVNYEPNTRANNQPLPGEVIDGVEHNHQHKSQMTNSMGNLIGGQKHFFTHGKTGCPFSFSNKNNCVFPNSDLKVRARSVKFTDHFSQATARYLAMSDKQRHTLISAFHYELGHVGNITIRRNMIKYLANIHNDLANMVAEKLVLE